MSWINKHQRVWRAALLVLWLGAMMGPWGFEQVNVPAEFPCHAPYIRLEGDFCGMPLSGMYGLFSIVGGLVVLVTQPFREAITFADWARNLRFIGLGLLLFAAPFSSLLLVISGGSRRRWQVVNIAAWGLALSVVFLWVDVLSTYLSRFSGVWGVWLYVGLAGSALILEVLALVAGRRPDQG
jgi:hypothetical protein